MNAARLTNADLDDWSRRRDSEGHLPTLVRRLIMASVRPTWIRMPAAEGVALAGLDGVVTVSGGAPPYVPAGDSVWELGTNEKRRAKATSDYDKRTAETPEDDRKHITYVCVLSRKWGSGEKWITEMKARGDEWKDIIVLAADELALWLESCPGVEAWLREHLGKSSLGDIGIDDWFTRWSRQTQPATPAALLTAGRRKDVIRVLNAFDTSPDSITVAAASVEEAVAFIAAALLLGPEPLPQAPPGGEAPTGEDDNTHAPEPDPALRSPEHLEALRARTLVVTDEDGWRRWSTHHSPHILVPLFVPDSVAEAIDAGHHVVLPLSARAAHEKGRLLSLDPHSASAAWQRTGIDFYKAQDYAFASRRNLGSLRRRLNRYDCQTPSWADGPTAALLASTLLAGAWDAGKGGDQEVLLALTGYDTWQNLTKTLTPLTVGEDPPLSILEDQWDFVDVIDAWDAISDLLTPDDLTVFTEAAKKVLTETDPEASLTTEERLKLSLSEQRPTRHYSRVLRRGLATTLAILGSVVGDRTAAGTYTGRTVSTVAVRDLLNNADEHRWHVLVDELQLLAEAAPEAFLDAVEASLRAGSPTVMALFSETSDTFTGVRSYHSSLLWALENLAFSPKFVSRVSVILACLATLDPGGRLSNRPAESLVSILNIIRPDGAIDSANRFDVLDAVIAAAPDHSARLLKGLVENRGTGIIRPGPRYRDWPTPRIRSTSAEHRAALTEICTRLLAVPTSGLVDAAELIGRFSSADMTRILDMLTARWDELEVATQGEVLEVVANEAKRHRRYNDAAWAMPEADIEVIDRFLDAHGYDLEAGKDEALFGWAADIDEHRSTRNTVEESGEQPDDQPGYKKTLNERRTEVVRALLLHGGVENVTAFASKVEVPGYVGKALADLDTTDQDVPKDLDDAVLALLGDGTASAISPGADVAWGYAVSRAANHSWLTDQVSKRPNQAAVLLSTVVISADVLDIVTDLKDEQQTLFWSRANPYRVDAAVVGPVCDGLLAVGRPFSSMIAANVRGERGPDADLIIRVLTAPHENIIEDPQNAVGSLDYVLGRLLDRLEHLSTDDETVSSLEFRYLPALDHYREPRALHRELARKPELFAEAVRHVYKPDPDVAASTPGTETTDMSQEQFTFSDACFRLLHGWHGPLPGTTRDELPTATAVQDWVDKAREELTKVSRAGVASLVIGDALAAPTTDPDGTWPCEAVRTVLENEQDNDLEDQLAVGRLNQRGVHGRDVYAGGDQERTLAANHREWAEKVRNRWPRVGALLERLANSYDHDARREDTDAERDARRNG